MSSKFHSLYAHEFIRIASCVPRTRVADVRANLAETIQLARQCDALKAALVVFPELGLSAYAIEDLLFQDALLGRVGEAIGQLVEISRELYPVLIVGAPIRHGQYVTKDSSSMPQSSSIAAASSALSLKPICRTIASSTNDGILLPAPAFASAG